ncbi:MAG: carboxypeptidase regulatory-like domain-containing protein [Planctomycetota bacterium]
MRRWSLLAAIAAFVLALVFLTRNREQPSTPESSIADPQVTAAGDPAERSAAGGLPTTANSRRTPVESSTADSIAPGRTRTPYRLRGRIEPHRAAALTHARALVYRGRPTDERASLTSAVNLAAPGRVVTDDLRLTTTGEPIASAPLAADGSFEIPELRERDLRLVLDDDHYALEQTVPVHAPQSGEIVDIGLLPSRCGALVRGTVLGLPTEVAARIDASIDPDPMQVIRDPSSFTSQVLAGGGQDAAIAADGTFTLRAVPASPKVTLLLDCATAVAPPVPLSLGPGDTHEVTLTCTAGHSLTVEVTDETAAPLADVDVTLAPTDVRGDFVHARSTKHGRTTVDGAFTATALRVGDWNLVARRAGYLTQSQRVTIPESATVRLSLPRGAAVAGRVIDRDGEPIADAGIARVMDMEIPVFGRQSDLVGSDLLAITAKRSPVRTDPDGRFVLGGFEAESKASIAVHHNDFLGTTVSDLKPGAAEVEIVLDRPSRIAGRVIDKTTKEPILDFSAQTVATMALVMERATAFATLDPKSPGRFTIDHAPLGAITLRISAKGRAPHDQRVETKANATIDVGDIELPAPASVIGRVVDPSDLPVAGARVGVHRRGLMGNPIMRMFREDADATTDARGEFVLEGLPQGRLELAASHVAFASGRSERLDLAEGERREGVVIRLSTGGVIEGRILFPEGSDGRGWQVFATLEMQAATASAMAASDGSFRMEALDAGRYDVQAMNLAQMEELQFQSRDDLLADKGLDIGKMMRAATEQTVTGRVHVKSGEVAHIELDASDLEVGEPSLTVAVEVGGRPLDHGLVEANVSTGSGSTEVQLAFVVGGEASFTRLRPGLVRLVARGGLTFTPIGEPWSFELPADERGKRVTWRLPGGVIRGRVIDDASGDPIDGATVRIESATAGRDGRERDVGFTLTGSDGAFEFRGLSPGRYSVFADNALLGRGNGDLAARADGLDLGDGSELRDLVLRARRGAAVRVTVEGPSGARIARARVLAVTPAGEPIGSLPIAFTNSDGLATIAGMPKGAVRVVVQAEGLAPAATPVQELEADGNGEFAVRLEPGISVRARLVDAEGSALGNAAMSLRFGNGPWIPVALLGASVDANGEIDLGHLPRSEVEFGVAHPRARFETRRTLGGGSTASLVLRP